MTTALNKRNKSQLAVLKQLNQLAWLLDNSIHLPVLNYRIGLDALIGLIPVLGDAAGLLLSSFVIVQGIRLGVPRTILLRMALNVAIEAMLGSVPVVGDVFDATFKANVRNVRLLNSVVNPPHPASVVSSSTAKSLSAAVNG
ncbi:MAG TPA: DUF4112 domain-containing protein [Caldilineaceae bacterium]|nr:DUF4112 domain-containing protein [Caldilineaceae bacterium]